MKPFTVVVNDCDTPALPNVLHVRSRTTAYGEQNYRFTFDRLALGLPAPLTDSQLDWIELLGAIFAADMACRRGEGDLDWVRSIELFVPVRDPDYWEEHATALQEIFASLSDDRLVLHFRAEEEPASPPRTRRNPFPAASGIALLSGGMDSFVGGLALLHENGTPPLFLSHSARGAVSTAQSAIRPILNALKQTEFLNLTADKLSGFPGDEGSQRSRTLLYVGSAALVASALGIRDVFLNENGVMAIHLPLTEARIGSLSTRTAAPQILDEMGVVMSQALQAPIAIRNILLQRTKPDVVEFGTDLGHAGNLGETVSCWTIGRTRRHCGICAPCIMRRISCELHGVGDVTYDADVFEDALLIETNPRAQDNLLHLCGFVRDFLDRNDFDLELDYIEVFNGGTQMSASEALALHRRWAHQAEQVLSAHTIPSRYL